MPRKLPEIVLGPFVGGLNTRLDPRFVGPQDASNYAENLDLSAGSLNGLYGLIEMLDPVATPIALTAGSCSLWFEAPDTWASSTDALYVLYGPDWTTADTRKATYRTQAAGLPYVKVNGQGYTLGIPAANASYETSVSVSDGASGGVRAYAFTYYSSTLEWESNPVFIADTTTNCNGAAITGLPAALVNSATDKRIYATQPGSTSGTYYYVGTVAGAGTTFNDSATAGDTAQPLNWQAGGNPDDVDYPYDHGHWAAQLTVLADALYSVAEGAGAGGGGILFGAKDSTLYWSMLGFPWYQPATNQQKFDSKIAAIIVGEAVAYVFTETSVYQITGADDTALSIAKTAATIGVPFAFGRSVCNTPYGVFSATHTGITLFDGSNMRLLSEGVLSPSSFDPNLNDGWVGVFRDDLFILVATSSPGKAFIVDLKALPERLRVTTTNLAIRAIAVVDDSSFPVSGTIWQNGIFVAKSDGTLYYWNPKTGTMADQTTTRQSWQWQTGRLDHGDPTSLKRYTRFRLDGMASSIVFEVDSSIIHTATNVTTGEHWLPRTAQGTDLRVRLTGGANSEVFGLRIECEAPNG